MRRAAAQLGVHRDTAFRWRHRWLEEVRSIERHPLGPELEVGETKIYGRHRVLLMTDSRGRAAGVFVAERRPLERGFLQVIGGRVEASARLVSVEGRLGPVARLATAMRLDWLQRRHVDRRLDRRLEPVTHHGFRLRRWLRPFRGVSSRYLDNYLVWFRIADGAYWRGLCRGGTVRRGPAGRSGPDLDGTPTIPGDGAPPGPVPEPGPIQFLD